MRSDQANELNPSEQRNIFQDDWALFLSTGHQFLSNDSLQLQGGFFVDIRRLDVCSIKFDIVLEICCLTVAVLKEKVQSGQSLRNCLIFGQNIRLKAKQPSCL